jgi:membrane protein required for colicin V production
MNGIDIVILGVFLMSTLIGAMRGFTKELLSLFSWGGSLFFSSLFLPVIQGFMHQYIANPVMAGGAGFFCSFIISLVVLSIIANIIAGYIHESSFRGIDHSLGFGFGIVRGVVFISAAELAFSTFWPRQSQPPTIQTARFVPMARKGGDTILQILPHSTRAWILEQAAKVENQTQSKLRDSLKDAAPNVIESIHGGLPSLPTEYTEQQGQDPRQIIAQGPPQQVLPQVMAPPHQGSQMPSQMVVIRPPQPGQAPRLAPVSNSSESMPYSHRPAGLAQSAAPRDKQSTVDALSRLTPQSSPHKEEESGYTQGQRDDMDRLFRAADGS